MDSDYFYKILGGEESNLQNVSSLITLLLNQTHNLKSDVKGIIEDPSLQFDSVFHENGSLKFKAEKIFDEMTLVYQKIESRVKPELYSCTKDLNNLSNSLKEIKLFVKTLKDLLEIHSKAVKAKNKIEMEEYFESAELIKEVQNCIEFNYEKFKNIEVFKTLSKEVMTIYEMLINEILKVWSKNVNIISSNELVNNVIESHILLTINVEATTEITKILKASCLVRPPFIENEFSKKFLNDILNNIMVKKSNLNVNEGEKTATLLLRISDNQERFHYTEVFSNLITVIKFVKNYLDLELPNNQRFLTVVGNCIARDFSNNLITNYLSKTIPSCAEDFNTYKNIIFDAEAFEKSLQEIEFLPKSSSLVTDYARNINNVFAEKICQLFLNKARIIMKKDLHNIVKAEEIFSNIDILPEDFQSILKNKMNIQETKFLFSECQVSKHAKELVNLVHSIQKEIKKSKNLCEVQLYYTIRNIFEMYCAIVPLYHKKFLDNLPQHVALFHNNCLYFAHNLLNIITETKNEVPEVVMSSLLNETVALRSMAVERMKIIVTDQRNQILLGLKDSGFAKLNDNPVLDSNSEKTIRYSMRQLQILQTVWKGVLPSPVYNRALGFLVDGLIEKLINLILAVEDISAKTATDIASHFSIILEKSPFLFQEEKEIYRHVRKWQKFIEFVLLIKGSLKDIDDRWANGMGPLASEFTADEVKHLIRALFQNSNRRAALLARIR